MTNQKQYDEIGENYVAINKRPHNIYSIFPSFIKLLGDMRGKSVLDLACGGGHYTRAMKNLGAARAEGVDISEKMIQIALAEEQKVPLGIKYHNFDAAHMPKLGEFDIVTGTWLLHYAPSREDLEGMCRNISNNLKENGRFIGINNNPLHPTGRFERWRTGVVIEANGPIQEGVVLRGKLFSGFERVIFSMYYWSRETYESAMTQAGLVNIQWKKPMPSEEGIQKLGKEYWGEYFRKNKTTVFIEAEKGK